MVITGVGLLLPFADTLSDLYTALCNGEYIGGCVGMPELAEKRGLLSANSITKKAYAALVKAVSDRGEAVDENADTGIFLGSAFGSLKTVTDFDKNISENRLRAAMPIDFMNTVMNATAGQLAILTGFSGMNLTVSTGSRASFDAISYVRDMIAAGRVSCAIAGGAEELNEVYSEYIERNGAVPADGICLFAAESRKSAENRGAGVLAEVSGSAAVYRPGFGKNDVEQIMKSALESSGCELSDIDFVITSGSPAETDIPLPGIDIKKIIGETYSASAAVAVAAAIAVCRAGALPDGTRLKSGTKRVMINSFGFDGYMGSMVIVL